MIHLEDDIHSEIVRKCPKSSSSKASKVATLALIVNTLFSQFTDLIRFMLKTGKIQINHKLRSYSDVD